MDRGLKERLVGAAVLVAFGVWLVPWVLDGPERSDRPESDALELPAPTVSTPLRTHTITLDNDLVPPTPASSTLGPGHSAATPVRQPARDTATAPAHSSAATAAGAEDTWFVQIGSYAEEENARRQADRVSTYGFDARLSTFLASGRSMQRVRIGPQASRESALEVASALSAHGFVARVVQ